MFDIIMSIFSFSVFNVIVHTTSEYNYNQALNEKLKLMEGAIIFLKKLIGHKNVVL